MSDLRGRAGAILEPVARRSPLSPNALTMLALGLNLGAAWALASARDWPAGFALAVPLAAAGGLLDLFDGVVARVQGLATRWGDFLDHVSDRIGDFALLAGWVHGAAVSAPIGLLALVAVMLNGYVGTQIEATFRTREYRTTGRGEFFLAILGFPLLAWGGGAAVRNLRLAGLPLFDLLTLAVALFAVVGIVQRIRHARRLDRETPP